MLEKACQAKDCCHFQNWLSNQTKYVSLSIKSPHDIYMGKNHVVLILLTLLHNWACTTVRT